MGWGRRRKEGKGWSEITRWRRTGETEREKGLVAGGSERENWNLE